jgi:Tfp pilus assembly protein PilX
MKTHTHSHVGRYLHPRPLRGSALLTALIFAIIIIITVVSSISLSTQSLKLAHRTFFADAANNLAETGLEEAVWSFNTLGNSTSSAAIATAWSGWTLGNTIADVYMSGKGDGYTTAPTVTFSGGGGSGAAGTASLVTYYTTDPGTGATITHVGVAGIIVTNRGSGYTSAPTVTLSGGAYSLASTAVARLAATRTFTFNNLDQKASGIVKVWVAGYDGTAVVPNIVAKAVITPFEGPAIEKSIKVILSKNGVLPKGVVAKLGINWNGHPFADSFVSNAVPGQAPFAVWTAGTARDNTTLASLGGTIDLSQGTVSGNVMTGPGVTVTGNGTITGQQIGNFSYDFTMPTPSSPAGNTLSNVTTLPTTLPQTHPVTGAIVDTPYVDVATGKTYYYYYVNPVGTTNCVIGNTTITPGTNVVIVARNTSMETGFKVPASSNVAGAAIGSAKIYMDGPITISGNDSINMQTSPGRSWAGALEIYTTTTSTCTISGNAQFMGCIFAPNAELRGNGGGNNQADLIGSFVAGSITSNGHMNFHFDEALGATPNPKPWRLALWRELQTPSERAAYAAQLSF